MLKFWPLLMFAVVCSPAWGQQTVNVDEASVTADFDFWKCKHAARTLDEQLECTARKMVFEKKFYSDGTPRADDPGRGDRKWKEYWDQRSGVFKCINGGKEVLRIEEIFVQQNKNTGQYVITTKQGQIVYTPRPGDLCQMSN